MADMLIEKVDGKRLLLVPTYSMRSYKTSKYDLTKDGNMARILSFIKTCNAEYIEVFVPPASNLTTATLRMLIDEEANARGRVKFTSSSGYGKNAAETRGSELLATHAMAEFISAYASTPFDYIIVEQQRVATELIACKNIDNDMVIYWCVASYVEGKEVWFADKYKDIDRQIAQLVDTVTSTKAQCEWLGGKSHVGFFYDAEKLVRPTVFFPFRLSDPEYGFYDKFLVMMKGIQGSPDQACDILITDPNNSIRHDEVSFLEHLVVSGDKPLYNAILKGKPIVPYYADIDTIKHIAIEEIVQAGCHVICYKNETYLGRSNVHMAADDDEFFELLAEATRRK